MKKNMSKYSYRSKMYSSQFLGPRGPQGGAEGILFNPKTVKSQIQGGIYSKITFLSVKPFIVKMQLEICKYFPLSYLIGCFETSIQLVP